MHNLFFDRYSFEMALLHLCLQQGDNYLMKGRQRNVDLCIVEVSHCSMA